MNREEFELVETIMQTIAITTLVLWMLLSRAYNAGVFYKLQNVWNESLLSRIGMEVQLLELVKNFQWVLIIVFGISLAFVFAGIVIDFIDSVYQLLKKIK